MQKSDHQTKIVEGVPASGNLAFPEAGDDEISCSASSTFRAKEEEIERMRIEVRERFQLQLDRVEEESKRLAMIRAKSFNRRSLHHTGSDLNPYEQAISIIGKTLSIFDEDNLIPCFGFGDASTHDQDVFSFYDEDENCHGFAEVLSRYRELVPQLRLAGPTSFAPVIEKALTIVEQSGGQYHVLLIIADGQVTQSVDTDAGQLSPQEQMTIDAIVQASEYPLSIVLVGVGDGPWDMMRQFDDNIPARAFDNF